MLSTVEKPNRFRLMPDSIVMRIFRDKDLNETPEALEVNITPSVMELNIFEDLDVPFLTGNMHVVDADALVSTIGFTGSERVRLTLSNQEGAEVVKEFVIYKMTNFVREKTNDSVAQFVLHFMEPLGFLNNFRYVSQAYDGNHTEIIKRIYKDFLNADIDVEEAFQSSKVVVPNLRPLAAAKWLLDGSSTAFGEPFYMYSSLKEGPKVRSYGTLVAEEPLDVVFKMRARALDNFNSQASQIIKHTPGSDDNVLSIAREGLFRTDRFIIDPFTNSVDHKVFSQREDHDAKLAAQRRLHNGIAYDPSFPIAEGEILNSAAALFYSTINTSGAFDDSTSYDEEANIADHLLTVGASADRIIADKQSATIIIPGWHMLKDEANTSIGRVIQVEIPKTRPQTTPNDADLVIDNKYSGKFLISSVRHKFRIIPDQSYVASIKIKRASSADDTSTTGILQGAPL